MNYQGPFNKDEVEKAKNRVEVSSLESDILPDPSQVRGFPYWIWLFVLAALIISVLGTAQWVEDYVENNKGKEPFLDVSNRELSVFLWQFPSFLRMNVPIKTGYLPAFAVDGEEIKISEVDQIAAAPPELLFLYHTWSRLLAKSYISRPIDPILFEDFLYQTQEWLPANWRQAPKKYSDLITSGNYKTVKNLDLLPIEEMPLEVKQSFQGWKNYFLEGRDINALSPTYIQVRDFLNRYPDYSRNFWRNIEEIENQKVAGPFYLLDFLRPIDDPSAPVPQVQLSTFLKLGMYNAEQAALGQ